MEKKSISNTETEDDCCPHVIDIKYIRSLKIHLSTTKAIQKVSAGKFPRNETVSTVPLYDEKDGEGRKKSFRIAVWLILLVFR